MIRLLKGNPRSVGTFCYGWYNVRAKISRNYVGRYFKFWVSFHLFAEFPHCKFYIPDHDYFIQTLDSDNIDSSLFTLSRFKDAMRKSVWCSTLVKNSNTTGYFNTESSRKFGGISQKYVCIFVPMPGKLPSHHSSVHNNIIIEIPPSWHTQQHVCSSRVVSPPPPPKSLRPSLQLWYGIPYLIGLGDNTRNSNNTTILRILLHQYTQYWYSSNSIVDSWGQEKHLHRPSITETTPDARGQSLPANQNHHFQASKMTDSTLQV